MNVQNLKDNYPKLIDHMRKEEYSKGYINNINREIDNIINNFDTREWSCYQDVYFDYVQQKLPVNSLKSKRNIIGVIEQFDIYNNYPNGRRKSKPLIVNNSYSFLCDDFKDIIDYYRTVEKERGKKDSTIYTESTSTSTFLLYLQQKGLEDLNKVTEKDVLSFFIEDDVIIRNYSYKKTIAISLKACIDKYPICRRLRAFLPALKYSRKNIQYLTTDEITKIKEVLNNDKNNITLRSKAIVSLLLYTGLRSCDIVNLKLDSINLKNMTISIIQEKTRVPITIPLRLVVGNAIYKYSIKERPQTDCDYLFISLSRPFKEINHLDDDINKVFNEANIRQVQGDRRGSHIFRHFFATKLIGNGASLLTASSLLGHKEQGSINPYLYADFENLKKCALSIKDFPILEEVFKDEEE